MYRHITYTVCWLLLTRRELPSQSIHGKVRKIQRQEGANQTKASCVGAPGLSALPLSSLPTVVENRARELGLASKRHLPHGGHVHHSPDQSGPSGSHQGLVPWMDLV